jgi:secreted trypsin-like serine protease
MKNIFFLFILLTTPAFGLIGGKENRDAEGYRKHVVTLRHNQSGFCSGVAIAKRLVLTAAHCFASGGGYYVGYLNAAFLTLRVNIAAISLHPQWNTAFPYGKDALNDLALVHLSADLPSTIVPLPLARFAPKAMEEMVLVGFGLSDSSNLTSSLVLRELSLKLVENSSKRMELLLSPTGKIVTKPGNGSCKGDSGGPALRLLPDKTFEVVGISSYASGPITANSCGTKTVYMDVFAQRAWIATKAKEWSVTLP